MSCPHCGSENIVPNITIRWSQVRGVFLPRRGNYCTACGKSFEGRVPDEMAFCTLVLDELTPAVRSLQESGDIIVVRHRNGTHEVIY
jgi:predicted RNA-binding Zn-ribbon protein involved in translation (DUF1610 family)